MEIEIPNCAYCGKKVSEENECPECDVIIEGLRTKRHHRVLRMELKNFKQTIGKSYRKYCPVCGRVTIQRLGDNGYVCGQCRTIS